MYALDDTIAAVATPAGGAARGIIRISGPGAVGCVAGLFCDGAPLDSRRPIEAVSAPGVLCGALRPTELHSPLPCEVYVWPNRGYTGQPVIEVHTLGSPPLLQVVLRSVCAAGARPAEPGEFTLRAFLAGRIDLTQAEAVLGVIDATNGRELDVALEQLAGGLARPLQRLRDALVEFLAHLEASLDFADDDLELIGRQEIGRRLGAAASEVAAIQSRLTARADVTDAIRVVLAGRPNTGKSSLFNAIVGSSAALVSRQAGTTRDYLAAEVDLDGILCRVIDTAGTAPGDGGRKAIRSRRSRSALPPGNGVRHTSKSCASIPRVTWMPGNCANWRGRIEGGSSC